MIGVPETQQPRAIRSAFVIRLAGEDAMAPAVRVMVRDEVKEIHGLIRDLERRAQAMSEGQVAA